MNNRFITMTRLDSVTECSYKTLASQQERNTPGFGKGKKQWLSDNGDM